MYHINIKNPDIGWDKAVHCAVCALITLIPYLVTGKIGWGFCGFGLSVIIGFAKELFDKYIRHTKFDWVDISADIVGAFIGILLMTIIYAL